MNSLPGNPHLTAADYVEIDGAPYAIAQATLALAYEQRTASLIAWFGDGTQGDASADLHGEILSRLGLRQEAPAPGTINVPAPTLPTKAAGSKDSYYLLTAANNIRNGYNVGGSGVTNMIITLLTNTADAMEAEGK